MNLFANQRPEFLDTDRVRRVLTNAAGRAIRSLYAQFWYNGKIELLTDVFYGVDIVTASLSDKTNYRRLSPDGFTLVQAPCRIRTGTKCLEGTYATITSKARFIF